MQTVHRLLRTLARALLSIDQDRSSLAYAPGGSADDLLEAVLREAEPYFAMFPKG